MTEYTKIISKNLNWKKKSFRKHIYVFVHALAGCRFFTVGDQLITISCRRLQISSWRDSTRIGSTMVWGGSQEGVKIRCKCRYCFCCRKKDPDCLKTYYNMTFLILGLLRHPVLCMTSYVLMTSYLSWFRCSVAQITYWWQWTHDVLRSDRVGHFYFMFLDVTISPVWRHTFCMWHHRISHLVA